MTRSESFPIAIIGAGPVGLAAAAHLIERGRTPLVIESGTQAGHNVRRWGHIRMFSPWEFNTDRAAVRLLEATGWNHPDLAHFPTGQELVDHYLQPLAEHPSIEPHLMFGEQVTAITRFGFDRMKSAGRSNAPFLVRIRNAHGRDSNLLASAVIDTSGTVSRPNPLGAGGIPAVGENDMAHVIHYGVPDLIGNDRERYAGKRVLVVGSGDSAFNALISLIELRQDAPETEIIWAVRRPASEVNFGGGENDALPQRGALGRRVHSIVEQGAVRLVPDFRVTHLAATATGIAVGSDRDETLIVDEIIAVTGYRPDLDMLRELRLSLDLAVESPTELAPLIDPNLHSCGTVRPHGAIELAHPEHSFYIAGMKSYGRAPTFLMLTGYEQARSIAAALVGDWDAARDVQLELPETGVCTLNTPSLAGVSSGGGCCS